MSVAAAIRAEMLEQARKTDLKVLPVTVTQDFVRYLHHLGSTVPVRELVAHPQRSNVTALRHDVDYDLDLALEVAALEARLGRAATYFILHTAKYFADPELFAKCRQIQAYGHEIGLHTNLLTEWYEGRIYDIASALAELLASFRREGIDIRGVAAHGDQACYRVGFTNYWLFAELRPDDPRRSEMGVTAEGTAAAGSDKAIDYPADADWLERPDGARFAFWSLHLADFGLDYEASRVASDRYFSDSGGRWRGGNDPMEQALQSGRNLVLLHPIHWCGAPSFTYFLSTARSGSRWLANLLDSASSVAARHEFTLNHCFKDGNALADKRTGTGLRELMADRATASRLIQQARGWAEQGGRDYAECNVYLAHFLDQLPHDRATRFIHLHRHPAAVARSLLQRNWYATPYDGRYPAFDFPDWDARSQFEKICWYIRLTNEAIAAQADGSLAHEAMTRDLEGLTERLAQWGIALHPQLAEPFFSQALNATADWRVPLPSDWPLAERVTFDAICGSFAERLGYSRLVRGRKVPERPVPDAARPSPAAAAGTQARPDLRDEDVLSLAALPQLMAAGLLTGRNVQVALEDGGAALRFGQGKNGHLLVGGGFWDPARVLPDLFRRQVRSPTSRESRPWTGGWPTNGRCLYAVALAVAHLSPEHPVRLVCLSYDAQGGKLARLDLATIREPGRLCLFFRPVRGSDSFNLALYAAAPPAEIKLAITDFELAALIERPACAPAPEWVLEKAGGLSRTVANRHPIQALSPVIGGAGETTVAAWNGSLRVNDHQLVVNPIDAARNTSIMLAGGHWRHCGAPPALPEGAVPPCSWPVGHEDWLSICIKATPNEPTDDLTTHVLFYDSAGQLMIRIPIVGSGLHPGQAACALPVPAGASFANVGLLLRRGGAGFRLHENRILRLLPATQDRGTDQPPQAPEDR